MVRELAPGQRLASRVLEEHVLRAANQDRVDVELSCLVRRRAT